MPSVRIVFFDVDGVLVPIHSSWNHLHRYFGVEKTAIEALRMFERGEITYHEWMVIDTSLWIRVRKRVTRNDLEKAFQNIHVDKGFKDVIGKLKEEGKLIVLVSGGVDVLVEKVAREVSAHECYCNHLVYDSEGNLVPGGIPEVPSGAKDKVVRKVLEKHNVPPEEAVYVGDSKWDKEAFESVGLSILYGQSQVPQHGSCRAASTPWQVYEIIKEYERSSEDCRQGQPERDKYAISTYNK